MAWKQISHYRVIRYESGANAGKTSITVWNTTDPSIRTNLVMSHEEAFYLVDLLRNERPIWVDSDSKTIQVSPEPVGENE